MIANLRMCAALILLACTLPAFAQTRAWLDREQVTFGETATLNIQTDASVQQIDYAPLTANFEIGGQTVRRSFERVNGTSTRRSLFAVGIRPRGPGVVTVPALRVGNSSTQPLQMTVLPPAVEKASSDADAFLEAEVDADEPYVQQAVGMVVRLFVGVNLLSGQLVQDQPSGTSLQQVGEDLRYQRHIDGRRYNVIERRYLLTPERSGELIIPGARFNGQSVSGFFDGAFGDSRKPLSAAAPVKRLLVQAIPANAPQPWLPLRDLRLRYVQVPNQARAGVATTLELEMTADGAGAAQLPALAFPPTKDAQVFADPPQTDVQLVDGRPRATVRRRISIVPLHAGTLTLAGPRIDWWDATQGMARTATLPPLMLDVAAGATTKPETGDAHGVDTSSASAGIAARRAGDTSNAQAFGGVRQMLPWLAGVLGLAVVLGGWWFARHRQVGAGAMASSTALSISPKPSLADALKAGELAGIAHALCRQADLPGDDLDALRPLLDDDDQVAAVDQLQVARWGSGDAVAARAALRAAFAKRVRLRRKTRPVEALLPPLYPQS